MLSYTDWQLREATTKPVLTYLTHIEDLILTKFLPGADEAIATLKDLLNRFGGSGKSTTHLTVKMDGSPSIVAGKDPADGRFFIGTKGVFFKTPKIAKSLADVEELYAGKGSLPDKMKVVFTELSKLSWNTILQGDLLFTPATKKSQTINGVKHITFQPNTIVYAIPVNSELGARVARATIGITFHTNYSGAKSLETMSAKPGADIMALKPPASVLLLSNEYTDLSGSTTLSAEDSAAFAKLITDITKKTSQMRGNAFLKLLQQVPLLRDYFMQFQNQLVRTDGTIIPNTKTFADQFVAWLQGIQNKESEKRSTVIAKDSVAAKFQELVNLVASQRSDIVSLLEWQNQVTGAKKFIMDKLSKATKLSTFYASDTGLVAGSHEGFVASDHVGNMVKLVDRAEFSRRNFAQNG